MQIRDYIDDKVNAPNHYNSKSMESIDVIKVMTENLDPFAGYCMGNIIKYLYRYENKGGLEDLRKAKKYIDFLIEMIGTQKQCIVCGHTTKDLKIEKCCSCGGWMREVEA